MKLLSLLINLELSLGIQWTGGIIIKSSDVKVARFCLIERYHALLRIIYKLVRRNGRWCRQKNYIPLELKGEKI
jgi:hypothetical protein